MTNKARAKAIIDDILNNHLPRVQEGLKKGYVDENQILVIYDHAVRARVLTETTESKKPQEIFPCTCGNTKPEVCPNGIGDYYVLCSCGKRSSDIRCEHQEHAIERWNRWRGFEPEDES